MATLNNREKAFGRTALVLDKLADGFHALKASIALASGEEDLHDRDKDMYKKLEDTLDHFLVEGIVPFLAHAVGEGLTHPESLEDVL